MYKAPYLKQPNLNNKKKSKFDRIEEDEMMDEDVEDDLLQINVNGDDCLLKEIKTESFIESDPITTNNVTENDNNSAFDLRSILNGQCTNTNNSINNNNIPKANSQQWRLMYPNNTNNRPAGMPPLICNDAKLNEYNINQLENTNNDYGYRNHNNNNNNGYRNHNNNGYRNHNNNNNGNRNNNNNNRNRPYNNNQRRNNFNNNQGRNNYNNNNNQQRIQMNNNNNNSNQTAYQYYQHNNSQCRMIDGSVPSDLTIQFNALESQNSSIFKNNCYNAETPILPLMSIPHKSLSMVSNLPSGFDDQNNSDNNSYVNINNNNNNNALIPHGNTVNLELTQLSSIASTLLQTLRNSISQEQKPKYDMKLQKEIHSIQKKPMIYKCPNREVISSDGPGLNLGVKPTTTGISLNQRFA